MYLTDKMRSCIFGTDQGNVLRHCCLRGDARHGHSRSTSQASARRKNREMIFLNLINISFMRSDGSVLCSSYDVVLQVLMLTDIVIIHNNGKNIYKKRTLRFFFMLFKFI